MGTQGGWPEWLDGQLRSVRRPLLLIAMVWLIIYVPLAVGLSTAFPEERYEVQLDSSELHRPQRTVAIYVDSDSNVRATLVVNESVQEIHVEVPDGYVPVELTLQGYGVLPSTARFNDNRTWPLSGDVVSFLYNTSAVWQVNVVEKRTDVLYYRARGEALLDGRLLYRDVFTAAPPLINLFWLLPVSLGGSFLVFRLYFACFALLLGVLVLHLRRDGPATPEALFVLCNPLTVYSTLFGVQDDVIVALLYAAALLLLLRETLTKASVAMGAGVACKLWPVLLVPALLSGGDGWRTKAGRVAVAGGIAVVSIVPFAVLAPGEVAAFLRLYISGDSGHAFEGVSLWRYLGEAGLEPVWLVPVLAIVGAVLLWLTVKHRTDTIKTAMLFLLVFLLLFPKLHAGYYLPLLLFAPLVWHEKRMVGGIAAVAMGVIALDGWNWLGWSKPLLVPVALAAVVWTLLAWMVMRVLRRVSG